MRGLQRNQSTFYYRLYASAAEVIDDYGNATGEYYPVYGEPVTSRANISPATGASSVEQFGTLDNYDKVIVTCDMSCPIDEDSVLYIDSEPVYNTATQEWSAYDYTVRRVAKSLNSISIAVSKVKVS